MTNIISVSSDHLKSCNESYFKHLLFAGRTGATMIADRRRCSHSTANQLAVGARQHHAVRRIELTALFAHGSF